MPSTEGQVGPRKSSASAPTVQSELLTRVIIWQRVILFFGLLIKGIFSSSSFFSSSLKATGKDFSLIKSSILRTTFSQLGCPATCGTPFPSLPPEGDRRIVSAFQGLNKLLFILNDPGKPGSIDPHD